MPNQQGGTELSMHSGNRLYEAEGTEHAGRNGSEGIEP